VSGPHWLALALVAGLPGSASTGEPPASDLQAIAAMLEGGRAAAAESELRRMVARSDSAAARDLLGIALSRLERLDEAEEQFRRAVALGPDLLPPRQHLARLLLRQSRVDAALTELRAAAKLGPLERELALWLADAELARGDEAAAERQLESVSQRFGSVRALLQLAKLQARQGQSQRAAETVQRAAAIAPNSEAVLVARAKVSLAVQAPVLAIQALESLGRMQLTAAEPSYLLGVARLQIGDMPGATEALEQSLELEPRFPLALIALGTALSAQKRFEEAREVAQKSLRLAPESAEALAVLAEAEEGLGDVAAAEEHAAQALARDPENAGALVALGRIRMTQGRYEEARDAFLEAVASEPEMAKAHYQLSLAYARLGDRDSSGKHVEIYRRIREENDRRLLELRTSVGMGSLGLEDAGVGPS
jgi:tetratricopeptide (TPR) repeat protein